MSQPADVYPDYVGDDELSVSFLTEGGQAATTIATQLANFIHGAQRTLDIAVYDFRLRPQTAAIVSSALRERAAAGVQIRIAIDLDKPSAPALARGQDPAPAGAEEFVSALGLPWKGISGLKLMHHKYLVRDAGQPQAQVWTGSTNLTEDSWTLQENNILQIASQALSFAYAEDFEDLWRVGDIGDSGDFIPRETMVNYAGEQARIQALFSPGAGTRIDQMVADTVAGARSRVRICSMLLNSGTLLNALLDHLRRGDVPIDGVYDRTQMQDVRRQWQEVHSNRWKIGALAEIVSGARLAGKNSTPYAPDSRHDFMHNKILLVDDTVITGSYNFSRSAELNAENILFIESRPLADLYSQYIDRLVARYGPA